MRRLGVALVGVVGALLLLSTVAYAQTVGLVSNGSPPGTTPRNHQNEPAVALDANNPSTLVAGSNDFVDQAPCPKALAVNNGTCLNRAAGVGLSGVYFSFNSGHSWTQPTYSGWTNADCDPTTTCTGHVGKIHTLPFYFESQLVSFGDPAVAFGPIPGSDGSFSWGNGQRAYYANLATAFSTTVELSFPNPVFNGFVGVAMSRLDNPTPTSVLQKSSWKPPVIVSSTQGQTSFQDKEQVWADNAASSPFFGHVYVCSNDFRSNAPHQNANAPVPVMVFSSSDGGSSWTKKQVTSAVTNDMGSAQNGFGYSGCTLRTDSHGVVYLFAERFASPASGLPTHSQHVMFQSFDAGAHWTGPVVVANVTDPCFFIDPIEGRCVMDGFSGARTDLGATPSVSIANGAPTGSGATNEIVDAWSNAAVLNHETTNVIFSTNAGATWTTPQPVSLAGDRPIYSAPAIAPDGSRVYVVYEADTAPWAGNDFTSPRPYHGAMVTSALDSSGMPAGFSTEFVEPSGDLRATYPGHDLYQERIGDYVYAAASNTYGIGVWTSAANASVCDAVQAWRASSFAAGHRVLPGAPWPLADCPPTFGNTDILSISTA